MRSEKLLVLILLFTTSLLHATTYYVDATNGNDSNNGTTPSIAWQTISYVKVMSSNFQPGDSILFKRGEIWNNGRINTSSHASGTANNPITYGAYGIGAKPIITLHDVRNAIWTNEGNNIWSTITTTGARYFKNGVEMLRAVDSTDLGQYGTGYYDACYNGCQSVILYVYSTTNPTVDTFAWSYRSYTIDIRNADYINFIDLDIQGGASCSINIYHNNNWRIINCNVGKNAGSGIKVKYSSNILMDSIILNSNFTVDMSLLPAGTSDYTGCADGIFIKKGSSNITIRNCYFRNWEHASFSANTTDSVNTVNHILFYNNELTSPDILHGGRLAYSGYSEDGEYYNNHIHNNRGTNQLGGSRNHFHHNIIDSVRASPLEYSVYANGISMANYNVQIMDNIIENNVIANTDGIGLEIYSINFDKPGLFTGNVYRNNIVYNCGFNNNNNLAIQFHKDSIGQLIYNNIVEYNLFYSSNTTQTCLYQYAGTISDVSIFNTQDADIHDNIGGNPLFVNAAIGDYHLSANSPAIDAGTTPLSSFDYDGNAISNGSAADIGAYEYYNSIGISEKQAINNLVVFPNPANTVINITKDLHGCHYQIISILGAIIKKGIIDGSSISLSNLSNGIYLIKITGSKLNKTQIIKFIKE